MKAKTFIILIILLNIFMIGSMKAQDSTWVREYKFSIYNQNDLRNSSTNAVTTHRILNDAFRKGLKPKMGEKLGNITYGIYSFATTYLTMLWSHEFGHSLRADQVGGQFKIHNVSLPFPYTTMHLPEDINLTNESLSVTAGFEVNYLNVRSLQNEFVLQNGLYNEDLALAFANRLMYPLYASVIVPRDPNDKNTWIETAGDPVHVALPVFKNFSNNRVFMEDSTVNPGMISYYNQSNIFGSFFMLADPQFYREAGAAFGKSKTRRPIFLIGNYNNGWTYGTLFNVSPLGYELYMNNYIHLKENKFSLYLKYGRPFKNNGIGLKWDDIVINKYFKVSALAEAWDQDIFGTGISSELSLTSKFSERLGVSANIGYKTNGYVLGKQPDKGINLGFSFIYYAKY